MRMAAAQTGQQVPQSKAPHAPTPRTKQRDPDTGKPGYTPANFDGTLGQIKGTSIRAPQRLIQMPVMAEDDAVAGESETSREFQEISWRRKVLLGIEAGYRYLLMIEDRFVKMESPRLPGKVRAGVEKDTTRVLQKLFDLLEICPVSKTWAAGADQQLQQFLAIFKGKVLVSRYFRFTDPRQTHALLLAVLRAMYANGDGDSHFDPPAPFPRATAGSAI